MTENRQILVAGAGIAGLTAALAFAQRGFAVHVFEKAEQLEEIGAGIQLSPNATRILAKLGVLERLLPAAVRPDAVVLRRASSLKEVARIPLGDMAERRWGAPYLVVHRAELQAALLDAAVQAPAIQVTTGVAVTDFALEPPRLTTVDNGDQRLTSGLLTVAADGVWSTIRGLAGETGASRFIGQIAWRRTIEAAGADGGALLGALGENVVTALLHPGFHLIVYPVNGGEMLNLVAFTRGREIARGWTQAPSQLSVLQKAVSTLHSAVRNLVTDGAGWTAWPIHVADLDGPWIEPRGLALIGDAAHAMTPFAAQGAAMAIEDAETLAQAVADGSSDLANALTAWSIARRRRVLRVARRGALNEFAWHARGPVALARDTFLGWRGSDRLAADLDWLYDWRPVNLP